MTGLPVDEVILATDDLVTRLLDAVDTAGERLRDGDVVCVASKVVALTEGRTVAVDDDPDAVRRLARGEAAEVVADAPAVLVVRTRHGHVVANAGIDRSNVASGTAILLPADPDASADAIRREIAGRTGIDVAVIVTDTFGRPWRNGQTDVAIGLSGMAALRDERGQTDLAGRALHVTVAAIGDAVAAACDLARSKASATPFVLVRGVDRGKASTAHALVRPVDEDLFRFGGPTAAEQAIERRRTIRTFIDGTAVDERVLAAAVRAAS
ncbi:MAG: coenzyme F420-0:L-glutamate ligase, partial [Nitriliruptoraceae bacterium]